MSEPSGKPVIVELKDVRKSLNGKEVHKGVSLAIRENEIMALVGGSGQGKTVLLKEIIGLMRPDSGEIDVCGRDVVRMSERDLLEVRREAAMVFQGSALFDSLNVADNISYGLREHYRDMPSDRVAEVVREKLKLVDLEGIEKIYPAELSGGMKKRVALARALALDPKIILYDEPTTGLDPANVRRINLLIRRLRDNVGVTSIMVTHDMQSVQAVTDRVALLDGGKILAVGSWEELESSPISRVRQFLAGEID